MNRRRLIDSGTGSEEEVKEVVILDYTVKEEGTVFDIEMTREMFENLKLHEIGIAASINPPAEEGEKNGNLTIGAQCNRYTYLKAKYMEANSGIPKSTYTASHYSVILRNPAKPDVVQSLESYQNTQYGYVQRASVYKNGELDFEADMLTLRILGTTEIGAGSCIRIVGRG